MTEIIEPHPKLVEYFSLAKSLDIDFYDTTKFIDDSEWHYITSNIENNIFLLKRLQERKLLPDEVNMVDCGIGLGTALFDFYLQSKGITGFNFRFTGIEKQEKYLDFLKINLLHLWNGALRIIESDIRDVNYSEFNIVYIFTPFTSVDKLKEFYQKVSDEILPGSLIIENRNYGLGYEKVLTKVSGLEMIEIDDIFIFKKI